MNQLIEIINWAIDFLNSIYFSESEVHKRPTIEETEHPLETLKRLTNYFTLQNVKYQTLISTKNLLEGFRQCNVVDFRNVTCDYLFSQENPLLFFESVWKYQFQKLQLLKDEQILSFRIQERRTPASGTTTPDTDTLVEGNLRQLIRSYLRGPLVRDEEFRYINSRFFHSMMYTEKAVNNGLTKPKLFPTERNISAASTDNINEIPFLDPEAFLDIYNLYSTSPSLTKGISPDFESCDDGLKKDAELFLKGRGSDNRRRLNYPRLPVLSKRTLEDREIRRNLLLQGPKEFYQQEESSSVSQMEKTIETDRFSAVLKRLAM